MEPHPSSAGAASSRSDRRRRELSPLGRAWLEERALRYVARWESSAAGVRSILERKIHARCEASGEAPDAALEMIEAVVAGLVDRGYVDDRRYATTTFERLRREGRSAAQIRARLVAKGISEELLDEFFAGEREDVETQAAWQFARRRRLGPFCPDPKKRERERERHLAALGRRGFELETALAIVDAPEPPTWMSQGPV